MPHKSDGALIADMLKYGGEAMEFIRGKTLADYESDDLLRSAVERKIEIVGEAARHISHAFQTNHPEIKWRAISAQRHVLAHEYGEVNDERIWRVATIHLPEVLLLLSQINPLSS